MSYVSHPLIKPRTIEARLYQEVIMVRASKGNSLVILPTGMGKTIIASLLIAYRLSKVQRGKILFLAPTRPLVNQHVAELRRILNINPSDISPVTGALRKEERAEIWHRCKVIVGTPQAVESDLSSGISDLRDFSMLIIDEAHRAVGNYPYVTIASVYKRTSTNPLILALTASPGAKEEKLSEICSNLSIKNIIMMDRENPVVAPYVSPVKFEYVKVQYPEAYGRAVNMIEGEYQNNLRYLQAYGVIGDPTDAKISKLIELQRKARTLNMSGVATIRISTAVKLYHMRLLLETQGIPQFLRYIEKLKRDSTKSSKLILASNRVKYAVSVTENLRKLGVLHPKLSMLINIISNMVKDGSSKIIVFANYRDTVELIVDALSKIPKCKPAKLIGQGRRGEFQGMSQAEQVEVLRKFTDGFYNILVSTSVGEEGLDIPEVDLVVFYDVVPSEIRSIQRRGRTARRRPGRVIVFYSPGIEEAYLNILSTREQRMRKILKTSKAGKIQLKLV